MEEEATTAIAARAGGAVTRLLGLSRRDEFQAILAPARSPVRRMRDLRDRPIGLPAYAGSRPARAAALRGVLGALESEGLGHRHVDWVELTEGSQETPFAAELDALERGRVDAVYVRGAAAMAAMRASSPRVVFDIGAHRDRWVRSQTALLTATVGVEGSDGVAGQNRVTSETLQLAHDLKHFLLRWEFISNDFDLRAWAHLEPEGAGGRRTVAVTAEYSPLVL